MLEFKLKDTAKVIGGKVVKGKVKVYKVVDKEPKKDKKVKEPKKDK